jgi:hypothetical protein
MALNDILIRIRTAWEGQGAQSAAKGLDAIDASSRRAAPALERTAESAGKVGKATRVSAEEFTRAARTASVLSGSMEGMGALVSQVASRFAGMAAAVPIIGGIAAAVTAWYAAITAVIDAQKAVAANLRDITATNSENAVRGMAKAFDDLQKSISLAADEQKRFVDGQQAMADAQKELTLANIDAAEQAELSKEADPLRQAVIKARFAEQRSGVNTSASTEAEMRKADSLDRQRSLAELSQQTAAEQVSALRDAFARASAIGTSLAEKQRAAMNSAWTPIGEGIAGENWQKERDRNLKAQQDILGQIEAAREIEKKSRIEADSTRTLLEAQLIRVQAARVSGTTTTTAAAAGTTSATTAVAVAETEAQHAAMKQQRAEAASQLLAWQAQAASAQSVIDSAQSRIDAGTFSAADNASAIQARSAAEDPIAQLTAFLTDLDAKLQLLTPPQPAAPAPAVQPVYQPAPAVQPVRQPAPAPAFQVAPQMDSQSMQQAVDASQAQTALLQSFVDRIGREMAKQNEILRNNALIQ